MTAQVYTNQVFPPYRSFGDDDIFINCTFSEGTSFGERCLFKDCTFIGTSTSPIRTGSGNIFEDGNRFSYVIFKSDNIIGQMVLLGPVYTNGARVSGMATFNWGVHRTNTPCTAESKDIRQVKGCSTEDSDYQSEPKTASRSSGEVPPPDDKKPVPG